MEFQAAALTCFWNTIRIPLGHDIQFLLLCRQTLHNFNLRFDSKQLLAKSRQDEAILGRIVKELLQYY